MSMDTYVTAAATEAATEKTGDSRLPRVAVVVVNWNSKENTCECLESVRMMNYPCTDVIVVDNASADGSVEAIQDLYPEVTIVRTNKNRGTAGGRNLGIQQALVRGADFVLFLDNDAIAESQLIVSLLKAAKALREPAILGAKIYYFSNPNRIWYAGAKWENPGFAHLGIGTIDDGQKYDCIVETAYACGCAFFASRKILETIGTLDEKYFAYFEETDFCYRAKKAGFKSYFVPSAIVWHKVSSSSGGERSPISQYFLDRNTLLWAERYLPLLEKLALYRSFIERLLRTVCLPKMKTLQLEQGSQKGQIFGLLHRYREACRNKYKDPVAKATLMGIRDYLLRRFGDCPQNVKGLVAKIG